MRAQAGLWRRAADRKGEWPGDSAHNPAALCSPEGREAMAALKAPFGGWGHPPQSWRQPSLRAGVNKQRNTGVSLCCTRPVSGGQRSRPDVGSAPSEPGAALARLRDAVNTRRRCKRRDRRSEADQSPGLATKEEVSAMLSGVRYSFSLAAPDRGHGQCCLPWMTRRMISSSSSSL